MINGRRRCDEGAAEEVAIFLYTGERVAAEYATFKPWIERALEYDLVGIEHVQILQGLRDGSWLSLGVELNGVCCAVLLCRVSKANPGLVLEVMLCAGAKLPQWLALADIALRQIAKAHDCRAVRIEGRRGWARLLGDLGYFTRAIILESAI